MRFRSHVPLLFAAVLMNLVAVVVPDFAREAIAAAPKQRLVQKRYLQVAAGGSVSVAFKKPNTAGNLLITYVVWDNGGAATLHDSHGNAYALAAGPTQAGDGTSAAIFYAKDVAAGTNTVTATFAMPVTTRGVLYVHEYSGFDRLAPLEAAVAASGSSAATATGPVGAGAAHDLVFVGAASNGKTISHLTHGFHARARKYGNLTADQIVKTAGTFAPAAIQKGSAWIMQAATFRPSGSTSPPTAYPLKVSASGRYLVDQNDRPFLITGDSPQALTVNLSEAISAR